MSGCACTINEDVDVDVDAEDCVTIKKEEVFIAITDIPCHECDTIIKPGDSIYLEEILPICSPSNTPTDKIYTCFSCLSIRKELFCTFFYGNLMWDLQEHISENNGYVSEECLSGMIPEAREKVLKMIDAYLEQEEDDEEEV